MLALISQYHYFAEQHPLSALKMLEPGESGDLRPSFVLVNSVISRLPPP